jgi:leader peptidase (prepilin peptidase)/N-methyltransferase
MIPIVSFLSLRGKCRKCGSIIPWRVLLVEILTAVLFAFLWWYYGPGITLAIAMIYTCILLVVTFIDLEHGLILNKVIYPSIGIALVLSFFWPGTGVISGLIGGAVGLAVIVLIILAFRGGMGWGDSKLAAFIGLAVGFPGVLLALLMAVVSGGFIAAVLLVTKKKGRKDAIPFGPFLAGGALVTLVAGPAILDWYGRLMAG